jgi:hypothetical protein
MPNKKKKKNKKNQPAELSFSPQVTELLGVGNEKERRKEDLYYKHLKLAENQLLNYYGVLEPYGAFSDDFKRHIADRDPCTQLCINVRRAQVREYAEKVASEDEDIPGWCVRMSGGVSPSKEDKEAINRLTDFFTWNGVKYNPDSDIDNISDFIATVIEEQHVLDKYAVEVRYTEKTNTLYDYTLMDAGTIRPVIPEGFQGTKEDIKIPRSYHLLRRDQAEDLYDHRKASIPNPEDIRYVQFIDGEVVAGFTSRELVMPIGNFTLNHKKYGQAVSPIDQSIIMISSFIRSLKFNANAFDEMTIPRIALAFKKGGTDPKSMRSMQREFEANFRGERSAYKIPLFNGDVDVLDLYSKSRDMEYIDYLTFCASYIFAMHGVDPAEAGLKLDRSQAMFSENQDARLKFSKSRGLNERLKNMQRFFNKLLWMAGVTKYEFHFTGLDSIDREARAKRDKDLIETRKTINEVRKSYGDPPQPGGDVIANQYYLQSLQMEQAKQAQEAMGEEEETGLDENMIDDVMQDVMGEFEKADGRRKSFSLL